jgi:hypothetical protein
MREALRPVQVLPEGPPTAEAAADARATPRVAMLIRAAKLIAPDAEFLCIVRDASENGVSVKLFHPLPADVPLALEMPNGERHPLERVWQDDDRAGFRFCIPTDVARIVEAASPFARRGVRVRVEVPGAIVAGGQRVPATIHNLSQQGALISTPERLSLIQRVKLIADGLPEIAAKVRWRRGDQYGLSFEDTFQFAELAALAFDLQRSAGPGTGRADPGALTAS